MARKSSYQKLKDRNKELALEIHKLCSDIKYRISGVLRTSLSKELNKRVLFGDRYTVSSKKRKPNEFDGILAKSITRK